MEEWMDRARMNCHKLIRQSKCGSCYDNDGGMNCPCKHELSRCHCHACFFTFFFSVYDYHVIEPWTRSIWIHWHLRVSKTSNFLKHTHEILKNWSGVEIFLILFGWLQLYKFKTSLCHCLQNADVNLLKMKPCNKPQK